MNHTISRQDAQFQQAFEAFKLEPASFDHRAHVRLAYIYLCQFPVEGAAEHMKGSLLAFLKHLGVGSSKFHETMTRAWVMAIRHFMETSQGSASSEEFIAANPRLLDAKIMLTHYSAELLFSNDARKAFVNPDLFAIPRHD